MTMNHTALMDDTVSSVLYENASFVGDVFELIHRRATKTANVFQLVYIRNVFVIFMLQQIGTNVLSQVSKVSSTFKNRPRLLPNRST